MDHGRIAEPYVAIDELVDRATRFFSLKSSVVRRAITLWRDVGVVTAFPDASNDELRKLVFPR